MSKFATILLPRRLGGKTLAALGVLACGATAVHASVEAETALCLQHLFISHLGRAGDVDVRGLYHASKSGSVRTKNASVICLKNIGLYSIAGLAYYFIGYNLMYVDVGSWIGSFKFLYGPSAGDLAMVGGR